MADNEYVSRHIGEYPELDKRLSEYIYRYGPRTMDELKLETVTMQQEPELLYDMVREYLKIAELPRTKRKARAAKNAQKVYEGLSAMARLEVRALLPLTKYFIRNRESLRLRRTYIYSVVRNIFLALGHNFAEENLIDDARDIFFLEKGEIFDFVKKHKEINMRDLVKKRKAVYRENEGKVVYDRIYFYGDVASDNALPIFAKTEKTDKNVLTGIAGGGKVVEGKVKYVTDPSNADVKDRILMTQRTDPGWTTLFPMAKAVIVEHGSILSHSAVIAREMGMTLVVGVKDLVKKIPDGVMVRVDGVNGTIEILESGDER